eukprot:TRINITY_DN9646_c0_g1_i3.p1 TRINITY_DN9646_c0_g1~~TRINITY_DN9646_c0_g1_i3.p1  ORF type:complete len:135 (+),score=27.57 TRINITY_DN9646_c0_g1_i3:271-675(+)
MKQYPSLLLYNLFLDSMAPKLYSLKEKLAECGSPLRMRVVKADLTRLELEPYEDEDREKMRKWAELISAEFGPFPWMEGHVFHLSMSYDYKRKAKVSPDVLHRAMEVIEQVPKVLEFGPPEVCQFKSMELFEPI